MATGRETNIFHNYQVNAKVADDAADISNHASASVGYPDSSFPQGRIWTACGISQLIWAVIMVSCFLNKQNKHEKS